MQKGDVHSTLSDSTFRNYTINDTDYILDNSTIGYNKCNKIPFEHKLFTAAIL